MSAGMKKRFGVTVNLYLDGQGYDCSDVSCTCDIPLEERHKCPFAMGAIMPMEEGAECCFREGGTCRKLAANLDALKNTQAMLKKYVAEVEAQMEDA